MKKEVEEKPQTPKQIGAIEKLQLITKQWLKKLKQKQKKLWRILKQECR
jgi:hypothetical protein